MSNTYDFLGDQTDFFMKSSWQVYCDASGRSQYVGKTGNEKTISPSTNLSEWWDNTSGVESLYVIDVSRFGISVNFTFMQVLDPNTLALAWNTDLDTSNANFNYSFLGSAPNALSTDEWRFVGKGRGGLGITLVIRKGIAIPNGDWSSGGTDYTSIPITVRATQDTSITNTKRDLAYFIIDKRSNS